MTKLLGCVLLFAGALELLQKQCRERERRRKTLWALQSDLERIATDIRWHQMPLPEAIAARRSGKYTGDLFGQLLEKMQGDIPLDNAWTEVFNGIGAPCSEVLCAMTLQGDREHLLRQFAYAQDALRHHGELMEAEEREKRKLSCATVLAGTAVAMIVLL